MRRNLPLEGVDRKGVPKCFWHCAGTVNVSGNHDLLDAPPCRSSAPWPQPTAGLDWIALSPPKVEFQVKFANNAPRQGNLSDYSTSTTLQRFNARGASIEVYGGRRKGKC